MANMRPEVTTQDGVTIIALGPEYKNLDDSMLDDLQSAIIAAVDAAEPPRVVLNLEHTEFFGSAFIEVLFRISKRVEEREGKFAICCLTTYCAEVITVTHLDRIWTIKATRDEAVAAVNGG